MTTGWRSCLYAGLVTHERLRPIRHRFAYRVLSLHLDLDELPELDRRLRLFSAERANLLAFRSADHGGTGEGGPLRAWALGRLAEEGIHLARPCLSLLCFPRLLGYVFNPLSIFFCHEGPDERPAAVIYEVSNTLGGRHCYTVRIEEGPLRHARAKGFQVSPFMPMAGRYQFRLRPPGGERLGVTVRHEDRHGPLLVARLTGRRVPLTDRAILGRALADPLMTLRVTAGIHIEAARLWLKGAPWRPRQEGVASASGDVGGPHDG